MTVVLGHRPQQAKQDAYSERRTEWVERFQFGHQRREIPIGPPPVPLHEVRLHTPQVSPARSQGRSRTCGVVDLYASRLDAQSASRMRTGRTLKVTDLARRSPCTVIRETRAVGRGSSDHYRAQHPQIQVHLPDVTFTRRERTSMSTRLESARDLVSRWNPMTVFRTISTATANPSRRMSTPRRAVLASMVAILLLASFATPTLASQQRYEVQPGDTLESIAAQFGVDPEGIYRSSYMPNGYEVTAGQVIVIPEPGQDPAAAAQMAAEREGTSPWVMGAHWVQYGDTFSTIAAAWGVDVDALVSFNQHVNPVSMVPGERILIPWEREDSTASTTAVGSPLVSVPVPNYTQSRNLSCEYAATYAATAAFGPGISEWTFIENVPLANNPHYGYRGNIDGSWGNTTDYGVYAEALVPTLNANGYAGEVMYTMGDTGPLVSHLDAGHPVVVWLGYWGDTRERLYDEDTYSVFAGMHVVTVYGYDDAGVYVMDPAKGYVEHYDWTTFQQLWTVVDGMGLAVYPAG